MTFINRNKRFDYMPIGSYAVLPDGKPLFLTELSEEIKERFTNDLELLQAEQDAMMGDPDAYIW